MKRRAMLLVATTVLLLAGCSPSTRSLENAVEDKPGVISVEATEAEGDDGFPGQKIPKQISVVMDADASAGQVMAVFEEFEDDVDDDDVEFVEVTLDGPKQAALATGEGMRAADRMAEDLIDAQHDDDVLHYRRQAYPVLPSVEITLVPLDLDQVIAVADHYRDAEGIELVQVISGDFVLIRDEVNEDLAFTDARERFVRRANLEFRLTGAVIAGRGPLRLQVAPSEAAALRAYVRDNVPPGSLGRVVVNP